MAYVASINIRSKYYLPNGQPAAGYWAFFFDQRNYPNSRNVFYRSATGYIPAPNPIRLDAAGATPEEIYFLVSDTDDADYYTVEIHREEFAVNPAVQAFANMPYFNRSSGTGGGGSSSPSNYPDLNDDPTSGAYLRRIYTNGQPSGVSWGADPAKYANLTLSNCIVEGVNVSLLPSGDSIAITAGTSIFVSGETVTEVKSAAVAQMDIVGIDLRRKSFLYMDTAGSFSISDVGSKATPYGNLILVAILDHADSAKVVRIIYAALSLKAQEKRFKDFVDTFGGYRTTCKLSKNGNAIDLLGGNVYGYGVNPSDRLNYGSLQVTASTGVTFRMRKKDGTELPPFSAFASDKLLKEDGKEVTTGSFCYFPVFLNPDNDFLIQAAATEYNADDIPSLDEFLNSFDFNEDLLNYYPNISVILYQGGTGFDDASNEVRNIGRQFGNSVTDVTYTNELPEIPADGSEQNSLIITGAKSYEHGLKFDASAFDRRAMMVYNPNTGSVEVESVPNPVPASSVPVVSYDRVVSLVMQDHGTIKQKKDIDFVPLLFSDRFNLDNYAGDFIAEISRAYNDTPGDITPNDQPKYLKISDAIKKIIPTTLDDSGGDIYSTLLKKTYDDATDKTDIKGIFTQFFKDMTINPGEMVVTSLGSSSLSYFGDTVKVALNPNDSSGLSLGNVSSDPITSTLSIPYVPHSAHFSDMFGGRKDYKLYSFPSLFVFFVAFNDFDNTATNVIVNLRFSITWSSPFPNSDSHYQDRNIMRDPNNSGTNMNFFTMNLPTSDSINPKGQDLTASYVNSKTNVDFILSNSSNDISAIDSDFVPVANSYGYGRSYVLDYDDLTAESDGLSFSGGIGSLLTSGILLSSSFSSSDVSTYIGKDTQIDGNKKVICVISHGSDSFSKMSYPFVFDGYQRDPVVFESGAVKVDLFDSIPPTGSIGKDQILLDFGKLGDYNISADKDPIKKGGQIADIVAGTVLLTFIIDPKDKTTKGALDFNPMISGEGYPYVYLEDLPEPATPFKLPCKMSTLDIRRLVYSVDVTAAQIRSKHIKVKLYGFADFAAFQAAYTLTLGVVMRSSIN